MTTNKLLLFFLLIIIEVASYGKRTSNLDEVSQVEPIETIYPKDSPFKMDIKHWKYNRTAILYEINATITENIDHTFYLKLEAQIWGTGGWKRNLINYENYDPCNQFKFVFGSEFADLFAKIGFGRGCPFKPGVYYYKDRIEVALSPRLSLYHGRLRLIVKIYKNRRQLIFTLIDTVNVSEAAHLK